VQQQQIVRIAARLPDVLREAVAEYTKLYIAFAGDGEYSHCLM
jgi:hypothetical protein